MSLAAAQTSNICLDFGGKRPCCYRTTDPGMAPGGNTGQDSTMMPSGITSYSQAISHYSQTFSSASFYCAMFFCFSSVSLPLTCSSKWHLGSLSIWDHVMNALPCLCIVVSGRGHLRYGLPHPSLPSARMIVISGLLPVLGAHLGLPGTRLMIVSGLLFFRKCWATNHPDVHRLKHEK